MNRSTFKVCQSHIYVIREEVDVESGEYLTGVCVCTCTYSGVCILCDYSKGIVVVRVTSDLVWYRGFLHSSLHP